MKTIEKSAMCWIDEAGLYRLEFTIDDLPKSLNEMLGRNQFTARSNAKKWKQMVYLTVKSLAPPSPLERVLITATRFSTRSMDYDGLVGSFKPVIDGLCPIREKPPRGLKRAKAVKRAVLWPGIIKDDAWDITGPWIVLQQKVKPGFERIKIEIKEVRPI